MHCCRVTAIIFGYMAIFFSVVSVLSPSWLKNDVTRAEVGYLQTCRDGICIDVSDLVLSNTEVRTSFTFMMIGTLMLIFSVMVMSSGGDDKRMRSLRFGGNMAVIAGIFILVAAAIYTNYFISFTVNQPVRFGYSYSLAWVACVIAILAGLFTLCAKKPKKHKAGEDEMDNEEKDAEKESEIKTEDEKAHSSKAEEAAKAT